MNISIELTPELLDYIENQVKKGRYKSRSEVVREAIRMMIKEDLERLLEEKGLDLSKLEEGREKVSGVLIEKMFKGKL
jgi:putative addiction module CopG family antidote